MPSRKARQPDAAAKLEWVNRQLRRWQTRATRANNMVAKLLKTQRRVMAEAASSPMLPKEVVAPPKANASPASVEVVPLPTDDAIPAFLDRRKQIEERDAKALADLETYKVELKQAKAKRAAEKRKVKLEKIDAKLTGKAKAMPLTGRAAEQYLREGPALLAAMLPRVGK